MIKRKPQPSCALASFAACACFFVLAQSNSIQVCQADPPTKASDAAKQTGKTIELPWVKGMFHHVLDPPGQKVDSKKRRWYINDHCFFVDDDDTIHWFGITNPYPKRGGYYRPGTHRHIGHASAKHPFGPWKEHKHAFALPEDTRECIGACFVVRHGDEYIMLRGYASGYTTARSRDLNDWKLVKEIPRIDLGPGTRDPCVVKLDDGKNLLYGVTGRKGFSVVGLAESTDLKNWQLQEPVLLSDFPGRGGLLESPFVYRRGGAYYLFLNHSHHQYQETLVFRSEDPRQFDWKRPLCTLFTHAAEIFEWKGKTYISHCGIEDRHWGDKTGLYLAELAWTTVEEEPDEE